MSPVNKKRGLLIANSPMWKPLEYCMHIVVEVESMVNDLKCSEFGNFECVDSLFDGLSSSSESGLSMWFVVSDVV